MMTRRMGARLAVIVGVLSIIATGTADGASALAIDHIVAALEEDRVDRVEILRLPREVASRTAFTPEMLEGGYFYKLVIRHVRAPKLRDAMIRSLKGLAVEPSPDRADLRWGMLVFLKGDVRVGSIYMDEGRRKGMSRPLLNLAERGGSGAQHTVLAAVMKIAEARA